jgi:hypothetical protein
VTYHHHPVHRLWVAAGSPPPLECDGTPIIARGSPGICAVTGGPGDFLYDQGFSANFTLPRAASTAFRHAGESSARSRPSAQPQKCLSAAAVWSAKAIALRCATWILEPQLDGTDKLEFHPSYRVPKDPEKAATWRSAWGDVDPGRWLAWLLRPRPVGTIAAFPQYGIEHGGEQNFHRCLWPGVGWLKGYGELCSAPAPVVSGRGGTSACDSVEADAPGKTVQHRGPPTLTKDRGDTSLYVDPLIKLQSKHVAVYAQPSTRAGVLALQVDSEVIVEVETARWREAYKVVLGLVVQLREAGLPAPAVARALASRHLDLYQPAAAHAALASTLERLGDLPRHPFWPLFTGGIHVV